MFHEHSTDPDLSQTYSLWRCRAAPSTLPGIRRRTSRIPTTRPAQAMTEPGQFRGLFTTSLPVPAVRLRYQCEYNWIYSFPICDTGARVPTTIRRRGCNCAGFTVDQLTTPYQLYQSLPEAARGPCMGMSHATCVHSNRLKQD